MKNYFSLSIQKYMPKDAIALSTGKEAVIITKYGTIFHFKNNGEYEVTRDDKILCKGYFTVDKFSGMPIV